MTNADKRSYLLRFHRFQKSRETYFAPKIFSAIRHQYNSLLSDLNNGANEHTAISQINSVPIQKVLKDLYIDAGTIYAAKVRADLNRLIPRRLSNPNSFNTLGMKARMPMGFSESMRLLIEQYFGLDILNTSEGITETTRELIRQVFTDAYEKGEGINDIVEQLKDTELSRVRARLIARTETVKSANHAAFLVAKSTGLELNKEWLSAHDNRVRHLHRRENGKIVGLDDFFTVGPDLMRFPGDEGGHNGQPRVSALNVVNCRCTTLYIPID